MEKILDVKEYVRKVYLKYLKDHSINLDEINPNVESLIFQKAQELIEKQQRDDEIRRLRLVDKISPQEIAERYNLSRQRVHQIVGKKKHGISKKHNPRHLYCIQSVNGGPIKIGISQDPIQRMRELQMVSPFQLLLIAQYNNAADMEYELHKIFKDKRLWGEWFDITLDEINLEIENLQTQRQPELE